MANPIDELNALAAVIEGGRGPGWDSPMQAVGAAVRLLASILTGPPISITGNVTITAANASDYHGRTIYFTTAATITITDGLGISFAFVPPASGNASIAATGVTLNGAGTTLTRAAASNVMCAVTPTSGLNAYSVTGA